MLYLCIDLQMFSGLGRTSQRTRSVSIIVTKYLNARRSLIQRLCFCPIWAEIIISRQMISVKITKVDGRGNPSDGSCADSCRQAYERTHEKTGVFLQCFAKAPTIDTFSQ
jgi:hypothetical protein